MRVWLLNVGEPLPIDPARQRLHRTGLLAQVLVERGADVVWWTSTFRHAQKDKLFQATTPVSSGRLKLWCLDARPYRKNVSVARILANRDIAEGFRARASAEPPPDVILASYPIPELAEAGAAYATARGVPTVIDVRDLWPDIWPTVLPKPLQRIANSALWPFYRQSHRVLRSYGHITGITDEIVNWGVIRAKRERSSLDAAFPLAYPAPSYTDAELAAARAFWADYLGPTPPDLRICFFGNIGAARTRLDVMVDAVRLLPEAARRRVQLVVCGTGDMLSSLKQSASGVPQIKFPGWVEGAKIHALATASDLGALPYPSDQDFLRSIPNKAIEYLAFGLPILTSLQGVVTELIDREKCGCLYRETDPADMGRVIIELLEDRRQLASLSTQARRVFRERYQASEVYGRYADYLSTVVGASARQSCAA